MAKLPKPPSPLPVPARTRIVQADDVYWRIYFRAGPHPSAWNGFRTFGPLASARFDHHLLPARDQERTILYAASEIATCIAEFFQDTRRINRSRRSPWLCGFALQREITLLDLTGTWPTAAGASMAINSGRRSTARLWSQAIYRDYPGVEGLYYGSSMHANRPALALYERAASALQATSTFDRPLLDPHLEPGLKRIATALRYDLR